MGEQGYIHVGACSYTHVCTHVCGYQRLALGVILQKFSILLLKALHLHVWACGYMCVSTCLSRMCVVDRGQYI